MSGETEFRSADQEVLRLLEECAELRRTLKAISSQITRMETRVKAAFPTAARQIGERRSADSPKKTSSLSSEQALALFDRIVSLASSGAAAEAESQIERQSAPDLLVIAKELGVTFPSNKPSIRLMRGAILGKVRESMLLSRHNRRE